VPQYDVVIVADDGHGLLTERAIARVCERARFLAVNTQTNAGNLGFHVISKYPRADFIAIAEPEVRLQHRDYNGPLEKLTKDTAAALGARRVIVTRGKRGCLCYDVEDGFADVPAMAVKIVDRVGSGDALLALGAPAAAMRLPLDLVGFIGNVAGAEACAVMGNRAAIEPASFFRHVTSLLM
jgi:sugar/nucleoside kinase (ribokinase family)